MDKLLLKGGSLAETYLVSTRGKKKFVRKEISLNHSRELGYHRWYSQLKRLQRYNTLFRGHHIFPEIIGYGTDCSIAYFDMEYIDKAMTGYEFLSTNPGKEGVEKFFGALFKSMEILHSTYPELNSCGPGGQELYFYEEVLKSINWVIDNPFLAYEEISFNKTLVPAFKHRLNEFSKLLKETLSNPTETFSHGNMTLENLLYDGEKVVFIDLYEENIIDSFLCDYSQILQSCDGRYEDYCNSLDGLIIDGRNITCELPDNPGLEGFNSTFNDYLRIQSTTPRDYMSVKLLEISQFIRMLPFKKTEAEVNLFYGLASKLFHELKQSQK
jgi:hypothetical protein